MKNIELKNRFIKSFKPNLIEFVSFDKSNLNLVNFNAEVKEFLLEVGLPKEAAPYLSFTAYSMNDILNRKDEFLIDESFYPIGNNGSGDTIVIDIKKGDVSYFNHDESMKNIFINTSLNKFIESMCIFQENMRATTMDKCLSDIKEIDFHAAKENSMWYTEVIMELNNG